MKDAGDKARAALRAQVIPKRWKGPYSAAKCVEPPPEKLLHGIEEFNRGEYFEQHETLEELWRAEPDDVRYLYQGILQVGVGLHHLRQSNYAGALSKLRSGLEKLRWFEPECQCVDVTRLVRDTEHCLGQLEALGAEGWPGFDWSTVPKVRLLSHDEG